MDMAVLGACVMQVAVRLKTHALVNVWVSGQHAACGALIGKRRYACFDQGASDTLPLVICADGYGAKPAPIAGRVAERLWRKRRLRQIVDRAYVGGRFRADQQGFSSPS